jgi:2-polyprenyl-6-methoxyphenol hydroxylase-like FAD-dependent oxidoreductase
MNIHMKHAIIIGGSMGGLFAGLLLKRAGWSVDVYERVGVELSARGAGIVTHPELREGLAAAIGAPLGDDLGVFIEERRTFDREGNIIAEVPCPQITTSWNRLFGMLRAAFPTENYHLGKELAGIEEENGRVTARFSDGESVTGDLLIGADGVRSSVRNILAPEAQPLYAGYTAWRGMVEESTLPPEVHAELFAYFAFSLPPGEQMLGYPVAGEGNNLTPGQRRYNFVWYRPADAETELPRLLTDDTGKLHDMSIPPPLIARSTISAMRADAERVLSPQFRALVAVTHEPFLQPIFDLDSKRIAFGRTALLGDAAFVVRPHVGAGVAKAALDAQALASALAEESDVETALARYNEERVRTGRIMVEQGRRLGSYMRTHFNTAEERALAERHQTPEAVMAETALLDFIRG